MAASESSNEDLKRGPWSEAEDEILREYVRRNREGNWNAIRKDTGLRRTGKSCRMRWTNHLRPNLKKGRFSTEEEQIVIDLHNRHGNKWALIALKLPGRTDNEIKNYWNTRVKRLNRLGLAVNHAPNLQPTPPAPAPAASFLPPFPTRLPVFSSPPAPPYMLPSSNYLPRMTHDYPFSLTNIAHSPFLKNQPNNVNASFNDFGQHLQSNPYMISSSTLSFPNELITTLTQPFATQTVQSNSINALAPNIHVSFGFSAPSYVQNSVYDTNFNLASLSMNTTPQLSNHYFTSSANTLGGTIDQSMQTPQLSDPYFSSNAGSSLGTIESMQTIEDQEPHFFSTVGTSHGGLMGSMQTTQYQNFPFSSNIERGSSAHGGLMGLSTNNEANTYFTPQVEEVNCLIDSTGFKENCSLNYDPVNGSITCSQPAVMDKGKGKIDVNCSSGWINAGNKKDDVNMSHYSNDFKATTEDWDDVINSLDDNLPNLLDGFSSPAPYSGLDAIAATFGFHACQTSNNNTG